MEIKGLSSFSSSVLNTPVMLSVQNTCIGCSKAAFFRVIYATELFKILLFLFVWGFLLLVVVVIEFFWGAQGTIKCVTFSLCQKQEMTVEKSCW